MKTEKIITPFIGYVAAVLLLITVLLAAFAISMHNVIVSSVFSLSAKL